MSQPTLEPPSEEAIAQLREHLLQCIHPEQSVAIAHLNLVTRGSTVGATKTLLHCYAPTLDGNGRLRIKALAEFMLERVLRFVIPRKSILAAEEEYAKSGSLSAFAKLHERAKSAFTTTAKSGEGGEFLLFALAEKELMLTQILCKMSLKTSTAMHYHGTDGVFAEVDADGVLNLYWGESKLYDNPTDAITDCLASIAPHILQEQGLGSASAQDMLLLNEYADLGDDAALVILRRFLDPDDPQSQKLKVCGLALVAFDDDALPGTHQTSDWATIKTALHSKIPNWVAHVEKRAGLEKLDQFDMHFICIPMACANDFRQEFLTLVN